MSNPREPLATTNKLKDIVDWLKEGDMICLHVNRRYQYYVGVDYDKTPFDSKRLIYINLSSCPDLLLEDEWPHYIHNSNNIECKGKNLQTNPELIFYFQV